MEDFASQYRAAFEDVGRPLKRADGVSKKEIEAAGLCSFFLITQLYAEATEGSMPFTAEATINETTLRKLKSQWELTIQLDQWQVYKKPGRIIFLWDSEEDKREMRVGVIKHNDIEAIAHELDIELKETK